MSLSYAGIVIQSPPARVFDFCADLRNELIWNPNAKHVELLTDEPIGVGTRFRARWTNAGEVTVEMIEFDRPRRW